MKPRYIARAMPNLLSTPSNLDICPHDERVQSLRVRFLANTPPGPPDQQGRTTAHKILAVGQWSDDHEAHFLSLVDLQVTSSSGDSAVSTATEQLLSWGHAGAVTDIAVADMSSSGSGTGEVLLVVASGRGSICLARLLVPRLPGSSPADIQIMDLPVDDQTLVPWAQPHKGAVSSVDVHPETKLILSAGLDGSLCVLDPSPSSDPATTPAFKTSCKGYTSYSAARWADSQLLVSATTVGQLELWDLRCGPTPSLRAPPSWGPAGPSARDPGLPAAAQLQPRWLDVHPSRPNLCAVGCSGGVVAVWDLRMQAEPLAATVGDGQEVWEVRFDGNAPTSHQQQQQHPVPPVLFATDGGQLGRVAPQAPNSHHQSGGWGVADDGSSSSECLLQLPSSVNSFDLERTTGQDIVCVTDSQLVYVRRKGI